MYTIPKSFNNYSLQGEVITQISFGINVIILFFNKGYIQLSGKFSITFERQTKEYEEVYPVEHDFGLLRLLEKKIVNININPDRTELSLIFERDITLRLIGDANYESYRIVIDKQEIMV